MLIEYGMLNRHIQLKVQHTRIHHDDQALGTIRYFQSIKRLLQNRRSNDCSGPLSLNLYLSNYIERHFPMRQNAKNILPKRQRDSRNTNYQAQHATIIRTASSIAVVSHQSWKKTKQREKEKRKARICPKNVALVRISVILQRQLHASWIGLAWFLEKSSDCRRPHPS